MQFCTNCGHQLVDEANFCAKCGKSVAKTNNTQRSQEWAGELIKCPECGEVIKSFEINCTSCGHELDNIVVEVQIALENEEYEHALRIADSIDYQRNDVGMERKWDIQRQYWAEKVLEEATKNGIQLEYILSEDIDNTNDKSDEIITNEE